MLNIPPHLEACRPRGLFSIFHGTSPPVARRCPRASDLVLSAEHAFLLYERPGLHLQSGASAVGGVLHGARRSSRCFSFGAICDFNPRAPCGARLAGSVSSMTIHLMISIHAPRVGRDQRSVHRFLARNYFNPRAPCGARRQPQRHPVNHLHISIHAPRAGCDTTCSRMERDAKNFNPRTPCGVRPSPASKSTLAIAFQSTHPVRGATCDQTNFTLFTPISIHAPRAGCDEPFPWSCTGGI